MGIFSIDTSQRVTFVGRTGSGKTFMAKALLASASRLVVCDPKGRIKRDEWGLEGYRSGYKKLKDGKPARLYIPPPLTRYEWEATFAELYRLRNVYIYIDELYGVGPPDAGQWLTALFTRGRELGIGMVCATQRPRRIPAFALSEADYIVMFQLRLKKDIQYMAELIGEQAEDVHLTAQQHDFLVYSDEMGYARYYPYAQVA